MAAGMFLCLCAFTVSPPESSWSSIYSILGLLLFTAGLSREWKLKNRIKKLLASAGVFLLLLSAFFLTDYLGVVSSKRPPIYR